LIDAVKAAYRPADDDTRWHEGVLRAAMPSLDLGLGCFGYFFDLSRGWFSAPVLLGATPAGTIPTYWAIVSGVSPEAAQRFGARVSPARGDPRRYSATRTFRVASRMIRTGPTTQPIDPYPAA
jgi:hypothetical protein